MKNSIKKITSLTIKCLSFLAVVLVAFLGVLSTPLMNVSKLLAVDYNNYISAGLKLLNMKSSAKLNQAVSIPVGESDDATATISCKILNPKNEVIFDSANAGNYTNVIVTATNYTFTPTKVGTYKVQYTVASTAKQSLTTQEYKIVVSGEKATMSFEENSEYIIPSVTNGNYQIVLPNPTVKDSEGEDVVDVLANLVVTVKDTFTNTTSYSYNYNVEDNLIKKVNNHYAFTPNATADCSYIVTYIYTDTITGLESTEVFEISYEKEFNADDIKLGYKLSGSMPESFELGVEETLPTVSVYDENNADLSLSAYTNLEVIFTPNSANVDKYADKMATGKDYVVVSNSNKFTPMYPSSEGTYKITYNISTFYSLSANKVDKTLIYSVNDAKDNTAPVTYAVENYVVNDNGSVADDFEYVDASYKIPSKVATGSRVYFPAIYATDNFSSYKDLTLARVLVPENGSNVTLKTRYDEIEGADVTAKNNEKVSYKFNEAGTYTIRYEATDKASKYNYTGTTFTIVVEDGFVDDVAPRITLNNIPSVVKSGNEVSFGAATVVDYKSTSTTETEIVDNAVEVEYYYFTQVLTDTELDAEIVKVRNGEASALTKIELNKDTSKYEFTAPNSSSVTVVCVAYDDAGNRGLEKRAIEILDISDSIMPTINTVDNDFVDGILAQTLNQDEIIRLPEFSAADGANSKYLEGSIKVLDKDGKSVSVIGAKYSVSASNLVISNARFVATKAGEYKIVYTIEDLGGNFVVKSYVVSIADTQAPTISLDGGISTVEVGESTKLPAITVKDNGEVINNPYVEIRFIGDNNPSYKFNNGTREFTALESGIFTYEYYTKDAANNETISGPYTFEAKDTQKPVIIPDKDLNAIKTFPITKDASDNILPISIPGYTAEDVLNGVKEDKVIVKSPSEKELTVTKNGENYEFTPTVDGIYTVIYRATDNANNTTELTYSIKVGDNTKPSVSIAEDAKLPDSIKVNTKNLTLDLENISVSDAGVTKKASELVNSYTNNGYKMFTVSVVGPDGSTISEVDGKSYEYALIQTGKYTVTYTARDKAGNERIVKNVVEVYADDSSSVITSETWGIVLIIVALAVLAGVVIYFIKTRDKKSKKPTPTLDSVKKDDNK